LKELTDEIQSVSSFCCLQAGCPLSVFFLSAQEILLAKQQALQYNKYWTFIDPIGFLGFFYRNKEHLL
jgi:hypothetical protein